MKSENQWISVSDMMTGLMMVFLFIAVVYIHQSLKGYKQNKNLIYKSLKRRI